MAGDDLNKELYIGHGEKIIIIIMKNRTNINKSSLGFSIIFDSMKGF